MFFIIVSLFNSMMALYIIFSLIRPLKTKAWIRVVLATLILLLSQKMLWSGFLGELMSDFNPYSFGFASFTGFVQVALFLLFFCAFLADIAAFILKRFHHSFYFKKTIVWVVAALLSVSGFYEAIKVPKIHKITVASSLLPETWKPITVAVLSDLHIGSTSPQEKEWLAQTVMQTNAMRPDAIFITGDLIDGSVSMLKDQVAPLFDLRAPGGVYVVFGNHETYRGAAAWQAFLKEKDIPVLNDKVTDVTIGGNKIRLAGIYQNPALLNNQKPTETPLFLLTHFPAIAKKVPADTVAVQFSGHTHGGQFWLISPVIAASNAGFVRGVYTQGKSVVFVHSGTGLWRGFPLRLMTPSEVTLMTIERPATP